MQNFASGGAVVPQAGQRCSSAVPQDMQKRALAGFSVPQLWQTRAAIMFKIRHRAKSASRAGPMPY
jgi:hypothetical protein